MILFERTVYGEGSRLPFAGIYCLSRGLELRL
jgi:hypothetical protein